MNAVEYCLLHGLKLAGPEHPATLCAQELLSYGALAARVSQFATGLREVGVRPNDRVGMLILDTPDLIALHLGAVAAGAIAVAMSNRATAAELAQILAIVRPAAARKDAGWHECLTALISAGPIQFPRHVPRRRGGVAGTRSSGRFHLMPFAGAGG
jgi:acyl-CoA synthetase (AMP-forming)/AMP-acid ligase II